MTEEEERLLKRMEEVKVKFMDDTFAPVREIYIDLGMLKDLRLGWMISQTTSEERQYLLKHLDTYNKTFIHRDKFTYCFPELAKYEEQWQKDYTAYTDDAVNYAPDTSFFIGLYDLFKTISAHNDISRYTEKIKVTLNVYPYKLTPLLCQFADVLNAAFSDVVIFTFVHRDVMTMHPNEWRQFQIIFTTHIVELTCNDASPWKELANDERWFHISTVYAAPVITNNEEELELNEQEAQNPETVQSVQEWQLARLMMTEAMLRICCDFHFLDTPVVIRG